MKYKGKSNYFKINGRSNKKVQETKGYISIK